LWNSWVGKGGRQIAGVDAVIASFIAAFHAAETFAMCGECTS
jgi:hypothetical protein